MDLHPAIASALILVLSLSLFVWGRLRHDFVALASLGACLAVGLVSPKQAFLGFADPAVITVAAVLVVGRAIELTGVAGAVMRRLLPDHAPFSLQLTGLLAIATTLSAFMNDIAALTVTMPAAIDICRRRGLSPGAALMPLAFATVLGGMATLIGTPANLILSSFRAESLGHGFGFFTMTPVGGAVAACGVAFLGLVGWRMTPRRAPPTESERQAYRVFELFVPPGRDVGMDEFRQLLPKVRGAVIAVFAVPGHDGRDSRRLAEGDRLLISAYDDPWKVADLLHLEFVHPRSRAGDAVTTRAVVARGSPLIGEPHGFVSAKTDGELRVIAAGPRAAAERQPLGALAMEVGDQVYLHGSARVLAAFNRYARLLEVDRSDASPVDRRRAPLALGIYGAAVLVSVLFGVSTAITFLAAAAALSVLRLLPPHEVYSSIDWPAVVLLAAMIPVGRSFESSGAAQLAADFLAQGLVHAPIILAIGAMSATTMVLSAFLNNVATAVIMGPIAISVSRVLGVPEDALLLAVLVGASSNFLTPIGHQNSLLVMGPGGYRFGDYIRAGWMLSVIVIGLSSVILAAIYS